MNEVRSSCGVLAFDGRKADFLSSLVLFCHPLNGGCHSEGLLASPSMVLKLSVSKICVNTCVETLTNNREAPDWMGALVSCRPYEKKKSNSYILCLLSIIFLHTTS